MTNHIINQSGMVSVSRILNASRNTNEHAATMFHTSQEPIDLDEEQRELADVDQSKFERLQALYSLNAKYFAHLKMRQAAMATAHQETQYVLVQFLSMLNCWKLRKFTFKIESTANMKNSPKSDFIDAIIGALQAYERIFEQPEQALRHCERAIESMRKFNASAHSYSNNNYLVEVISLARFRLYK